MHHKINLGDLSEIDCVVHTGDFSNGDELSTDNFLCWFADLPVKYKILVAGNHDKYVMNCNGRFKRKVALLGGIHYLEDSGCEIEGIKFYGSPWVNKFYNWAFMAYESDLSKIYKFIPKDTQVLLSHGPAQGYLDFVPRIGGGHVGSLALRNKVKRLKDIKYHIFGHIHEGYGSIGITSFKNSYTAINASCVDEHYRACNIPIVIEI